MLDEDIEALTPYLDEHVAVSLLPHQQNNGWTDEMLRWGVLIHALGGALLAGDLELMRIPRDASEIKP